MKESVIVSCSLVLTQSRGLISTSSLHIRLNRIQNGCSRQLQKFVMHLASFSYHIQCLIWREFPRELISSNVVFDIGHHCLVIHLW